MAWRFRECLRTCVELECCDRCSTAKEARQVCSCPPLPLGGDAPPLLGVGAPPRPCGDALPRPCGDDPPRPCGGLPPRPCGGSRRGGGRRPPHGGGVPPPPCGGHHPQGAAGRRCLRPLASRSRRLLGVRPRRPCGACASGCRVPQRPRCCRATARSARRQRQGWRAPSSPAPARPAPGRTATARGAALWPRAARSLASSPRGRSAPPRCESRGPPLRPMRMREHATARELLGV